MNRTSGGLIAHLGYKVGGYPLCKSRMACMVVTADDTKGYQICKRCEKWQQKIKTNKKASIAAFYVDKGNV